MKITPKQIDALETLAMEKCLSKDHCKIHNNIMNSLYFKDMVKIVRYANGEFWELTDKGVETVALNNQQL